MSLKSNQEVFVCRDSEATWPTTAGPPLMHRVLGCSKMIQLRWFCLFIRKSSPQENILRSFLSTPGLPQEIAVPLHSKGQHLQGLFGVNGTCRSHERAEAHAGALILQLHHIHPAGRNQLCQLLSQLQGKAQSGNWAGMAPAGPASAQGTTWTRFSLKISSCTKILHPAGDRTEFNRSLKSWKFGISCKCYKSEFSAKSPRPLGVP